MPLRDQFIRDFCVATAVLSSLVAIIAVITGTILMFPGGVAAGFWMAALWLHVTDPLSLPFT